MGQGTVLLDADYRFGCEGDRTGLRRTQSLPLGNILPEASCSQKRAAGEDKGVQAVRESCWGGRGQTLRKGYGSVGLRYRDEGGSQNTPLWGRTKPEAREEQKGESC